MTRFPVVLVAVIAVAAAAGYVAPYAISSGHASSGGPSRSGSVRNGAAIRLVWPGALALGSHASLYIADRRRHQILARLPKGSFRIIAGNGRIYTDTALGNGFTNRTALVVVQPGESQRVLWRG